MAKKYTKAKMGQTDTPPVAASLAAVFPSLLDPDLTKITAAWSSLPEPIRRAMLALIR